MQRKMSKAKEFSKRMNEGGKSAKFEKRRSNRFLRHTTKQAVRSKDMSTDEGFDEAETAMFNAYAKGKSYLDWDAPECFGVSRGAYAWAASGKVDKSALAGLGDEAVYLMRNSWLSWPEDDNFSRRRASWFRRGSSWDLGPLVAELQKLEKHDFLPDLGSFLMKNSKIRTISHYTERGYPVYEVNNGPYTFQELVRNPSESLEEYARRIISFRFNQKEIRAYNYYLRKYSTMMDYSSTSTMVMRFMQTDRVRNALTK